MYDEIERMPYGKRSNYPHMKPADIAVWERFIEQNPNAYDEVAYDVVVGEGAAIPTGTEEIIAKDFKQLTQRKIDVVGFHTGAIDVIEVKPTVGFSAMGQAAGGKHLYIETYNPDIEPQAVVIAGAPGSDMETPAAAMGIKIIIV